MSGETAITITGNLTGDPELRYTSNANAVANFTVASTPRRFDKDTKQWVDGEALFLRVSVWGELAEHVAECLTRGMRVIVTGSLKQRSYETKEGEKRTVIEVTADDVAPSLLFATAKVTKASRNGTASGSSDRTPRGSETSKATAGASTTFDDEPPF